MKPYNKNQIADFKRYAAEWDIKRFTLHAYKTQELADKDGYTAAYNADVDAMGISPNEFESGVENLLEKNPDTDVTISSKVVVLSQGSMFPKFRHIPMLDFSLPFVPHLLQNGPTKLLHDVDNFNQNNGGVGDLFGNATRYVSGNSFHAYGLEISPLTKTEFNSLIGTILICDHDKVADHAWLGFCLRRQEFRLRLTAVQKKYTMIPTPYSKASLKPVGLFRGFSQNL